MFRDIAKEVEMTQGRLNISEIARRTGYDRKTVLKYVTASTALQPCQRKKQSAFWIPTNTRFVRELRNILGFLHNVFIVRFKLRVLRDRIHR